METIRELSIGTFKFKGCWDETQCGGFREYMEVYQKVGYEEETDPYEYIGDISLIDLDDYEDQELEDLILINFNL